MLAFGIVALVVMLLGGYAAHGIYSDGYQDAEDKHIAAAAKTQRESRETIEGLYQEERKHRAAADTRAGDIETSSAAQVAAAEAKAERAIKAARAAGEMEGKQCPALCVLPSSSP